MRKKKIIALVVCVIFMLLSLGIALYPMLSSMYIDSHQAELELQYEEQVKDKSEDTLIKAKKEAIDYNIFIAPGAKSGTFSRESQINAAKNYGDILNINGDSIMGFIEIPKISVVLPIYHGTDDNILERGIGHLVGSSVPIGGVGTHSILTGHSGMASNRMFSDLRDLVIGDVFYIRVLNEVLAYQVDDIQVVLPHEVASLRIVEGEDFVTLVTCTPYAVNTHRLLVRGTRIPYEEGIQGNNIETKEYENNVSMSTRQRGMLKGAIIGVSSSFVLIILVLVFIKIIGVFRKRKK